MRTIFNFRNSRKLGVLTLVTASILVLTSCSSFSGASYNDGIYGEEPAAKTYESQPEVQYTDGSAAYYEQIFQEGADQHGDNFDADAVFTDVDSYSSSSYDQQNPDETSYYGGGVAGWGENPSSVTINYIDNGWAWGGFGGPWGWNRGFGWGGWNNFGWGFNNGFGWGGFYGGNFGWGGPWGWNNGFGWGGGFYGGYGWNNWGWNGGYYGYNNNNYAYLNNRRDGRSTFGNTGLTGRATTNRSGEISNRNVGRGTYGESRGRSIDGNRSSSRNTNGIQTGRTSRSSNGTVSPSSRRSSTATPSSSRRSSTYSPSSSRSGRASSPTMSPSSGRSSSPTVSPSSGRSSSGSSSGRSSGGGGRSSGGSSSGGRRG